MISFLDIIFPKFCVSCRAIGRSFCKNCISHIPLTDHVRNECTIQTKDTYVDGVYTIMQYQGVGKSVVKQIKYGRAFSILNDLFSVLPKKHSLDLRRFMSDNKIQFLQPIPLHSRRERERGFNQSFFIAKQLSLQTQLPLINILKRVRYTSPQAQIKEKHRRIDNIRNAFEYVGTKRCKNKIIVLVDDLYTSGSTCHEAARILKLNGVRKVYVCALARG